jgi:hypothetical protein
MKGIKCCGECAYYNMKKHKCMGGAKDPGKAESSFYVDCPHVEAEPVKHGRWIPVEYDAYADGVPVWDKWECSECGHEHSGEEDTLTAFCPDCGTKMDGGADNAE